MKEAQIHRDTVEVEHYYDVANKKYTVKIIKDDKILKEYEMPYGSWVVPKHCDSVLQTFEMSYEEAKHKFKL